MLSHAKQSFCLRFCFTLLACHSYLVHASVPYWLDQASSLRSPKSSELHVRNTTVTASTQQNASTHAASDVTYSTQLIPGLNGSSISISCLAALTAPLDCASYMTSSFILYTWRGFPAEVLDTLCTDACTSSIQSYRTEVESACADDIYTEPPLNLTTYSGNIPGTGSNYSIYDLELYQIKPIAFADFYITNYNLVCLKDPDYNPPEYCYLLTGNGTNTTSYPACGSCNIEPLYVKLQDPRLYSDSLASAYSSSAAACSSTASPVASPTSVLLTNPYASLGNYTTPTCSGRFRPMPTSMTCDEVAREYSVSTYSLLETNNLAAGCSNWPGNLSQICIEDSCTVYQVGANDTCQSVAAAQNITVTQLTSWNYWINPQCRNWNNTVGHYICVSNPYGYTQANVTITNVPGVAATTAAPVPTDAMTGSNTDCGSWYLVQPGDYCALLATKASIALDDFLFLNPEVNTNCSNLLYGFSYCVEPVGSISTYAGYGGDATTISGFTATTQYTSTLTTVAPATYVTPVSTDPLLANGSQTGCFETFNNFYGSLRCQDVANWIGVSLADFVRWNPSLLDADGNYTIWGCKLQNNTQYCGSFYNASGLATSTTAYLPVPTDATANSTDECLEYYLTVENDTCDGILKEFDIPLTSFYEWNPAIGESCTNLWINSEYCVAGPGWDLVTVVNYTSTATGSNPTSTSGSASGGPPGPTQTGIVANCDEWYLASSNSTCDGIAKIFDITIAQFYAWNPAVGDECTDLEIGVAYCVGIPATSVATTSSATPTTLTPPGPTQTGIPANCDAYALTASGDGCYDFAARNGITLDELYEWNPVLNNECDNFWSDEAYCIGVSS